MPLKESSLLSASRVCTTQESSERKSWPVSNCALMDAACARSLYPTKPDTKPLKHAHVHTQRAHRLLCGLHVNKTAVDKVRRRFHAIPKMCVGHDAQRACCHLLSLERIDEPHDISIREQQLVPRLQDAGGESRFEMYNLLEGICAEVGDSYVNLALRPIPRAKRLSEIVHLRWASVQGVPSYARDLYRSRSPLCQTYHLLSQRQQAAGGCKCDFSGSTFSKGFIAEAVNPRSIASCA